MNQTTNTTASIDLAQLDSLPRYRDLGGFGIAEAASGAYVKLDDVLTLARRSLTSGAPAEPVAWIRKSDITELTDSEPETEGWTPLYTAPVAVVHDAAALSNANPSNSSSSCDAAGPSAKPADKIEEIRALLQEAHGFAAVSPRGKENINAALDLLDEISVSAGAAAKTEQAPNWQARRWCTGDAEWTDWADISNAQYDQWQGDRSFEFRRAQSATAAGTESAQPRDVCAEMRALCSSCGGTGDVHSFDGEWRGECNCPAGIALALDRLKIAAAKTQRENEELRAALARAPLPAQTALTKLECPACGTDRLKKPCPRMADECAMGADAHMRANDGAAEGGAK